MSTETRQQWGWSSLAVFAFAALAACGPTTTGNPDGGAPDGSEPDAGTQCELNQPDCCVRSRDCRHLNDGPNVAYCETETGTCKYLCNTAADCTTLEPTLCGDGSCVCDEGFCKVPACSYDGDCGGAGKCIAGECQDGEAAPDGCVIAPDPVYINEGGTVQLYAYATKGGQYVVPAGAWTWSSDDTGVVTVDANGVATGAGAGTANVTASIGGASCSVLVNGFAKAAADEVRVVAIDELTREPVANATVVVDDGTNAVEGTTGADGSVTLMGITAATVDVHVFTAASGYASAPNGYAYISVLGSTSKDLVVYLPRNPAPNKAGGFRGELTAEDFAKLGDDDVHIALAGASIPGNFIDLDLSVLVGEMIDTHVKFGNLLDDTIPLPSGLVLGVGSEFFEDRTRCPNMDAGCYFPLAVPGTRTAWALGGNLPLAEVTQVLGPVIGGGGSNIDVGPLLGALLPLFNRFNSAVHPGVEIPEFDRDMNGLPAFDQFPQVDIELTQELRLKGIVDVPTLPQVGGEYLDGAVVLGGVIVEGQGLVPLGLTAGLDVQDPETQTKNGVVNDEGDEPTPGKATLRLATQHGGVEGSKYVLLGLALSFDGLVGGTGRQALSGYAATFDGIGFEEEIGFGTAGFLGFAEAASYDAASRQYTPATVAGADLYRLAMDSAEDRGWIVYHAGDLGPVTLIDPTQFTCGGATCEDRAGANLDAQAVVTDGVDPSQLFGFNGTDLDSLVKILRGFSTIDISAP